MRLIFLFMELAKKDREERRRKKNRRSYYFSFLLTCTYVQLYVDCFRVETKSNFIRMHLKE